jgi:hypothetical protein
LGPRADRFSIHAPIEHRLRGKTGLSWGMMKHIRPSGFSSLAEKQLDAKALVEMKVLSPDNSGSVG